MVEAISTTSDSGKRLGLDFLVKGRAICRGKKCGFKNIRIRVDGNCPTAYICLIHVHNVPVIRSMTGDNSLNLIRLLRVVITPSVTSLLRGENDSKRSHEIQATAMTDD